MLYLVSKVIEYKLIRSTRKTLSLQVKHGQVIVRAPHFVKHQFITHFIQEKSNWLKNKISEQINKKSKQCFFVQNSLLFFLGKKVRLTISFATTASVYMQEEGASSSLKQDLLFHNSIASSHAEFDHPSLNVVISHHRYKKLDSEELLAKQVKKQLEQFFKKEIQHRVADKLSAFGQQTNLIPNSVKIRQYKARWGSCNNRGEVSFNYLLMMVPDWVFDYVIVHELCHLQHLNHSTNFWQLVASFYPNYREAKQWLKNNQAELAWGIDL